MVHINFQKIHNPDLTFCGMFDTINSTVIY